MSRIIVKNLPEQMSKEKLMQIFTEKGTVTDVQLKFTKDGRFRRFAYVGFQKPEMAEAAKRSFDKSFINTSRIQIETCAELGGTKRPRPWSKHAQEKFRREVEHAEEKEKKKTTKMQKVKEPQVMELLKNHKDDKLFTEFLEVNMSELPVELKLNKKCSETIKRKKEGEDIAGDDDDDDDEEEQIANKDISDSEYLKLKTGVNLKLSNTSGSDSKKKNCKHKELFTIKLSNVPMKVKKSQIKEFLSPLKPFTVRRALGIRKIAYCGFNTEREMKVALLKNRTFLNGKRIFVTAVKKAHSLINEEIKTKWKNENERLKGLETVGESGRIFVRNLAYTVTEDDLRDKFQHYGPITEFTMPIDPFTRKPKGFAFVTYLIPEHACKAFNELDGTVFQGRMLHLLPGCPNNDNKEEISPDDQFKKNKRKKEKAEAGSNVSWNTFFIGENALADAMAATYNTTKEQVLDDKESGAAVRLALGETQLISKMKEFLEENDVCLEAFENMNIVQRSGTVILVKNLPFATKVEEIRERFSQFGLLKRVVLPPTGVAALVEFVEPFEAKIAFRRLSYSKFKHVPLYLEWAPNKVFKDEKPEEKEEVKGEQPDTLVPVGNSQEEHIPVEGAIIFVKNLNFSTRDEALRRHFSSCGRVVSATVAFKKNPNEQGQKLSMGYGFVEFSDKESANKALKALQFSTLDGHKVELKRSNRTLAPKVIRGRIKSKSREKPSSKILVRNVPFQATQKEVADLFKVFGEIKAVRLPKKMVGTGSHRGFCFIEYNTVQDAKRAFAALSESTHLYGRRLVLEWAAEDDDNVAALRQKTAQQFKKGTIGTTEKKSNNITIEDELEEE